MREIQLTQGKIALVDDEDFERVSSLKWRATCNKHVWYAITTLPDRKVAYMHRFILGITPRIDHVDSDGLNNRRSNLRPATTRQNAQNKRKGVYKRGAFSQYKGVHYRKDRGTWVAMIYHEGKHIYIGCSRDEKQSALMYDKKAKELFGEFACPNFTEESQ